MKSSDLPRDGFVEGIDEGFAEEVGISDGSTDGFELGCNEGCMDNVGPMEGCALGPVEIDGFCEEKLGEFDGDTDG